MAKPVPAGPLGGPAPCPACGAPPRHTLKYPEGVVRICAGCGLQWSQATAKAADFVATDNLHYHDPASLGRPAAYPPYREFFRRLARRFGERPLAILDVGCGNGAFLAECLRRGHQAWGVEPDQSLRRHMNPEVAQRVNFRRAEDIADFRRLGSQGGTFDTITFWDAFEHLESAFTILEHLAPALAPGGVFYLRVNNTRDVFNLAALAALACTPGLGRRLVRACFNFPHHAWNFSEEGMRRLLAAHGFAAERVAFSDTPAGRLTANPIFMAAIHCGYLGNRLLRGGKIGEYYVVPATPPRA